jgi:SHS2 domain-containing protein
MENFKKFQILEHRADLKLRIFGKNKKELFGNALIGMENALRAEIKESKPKKRKIKVKSLDLETLLVDFLSEILYLNQTKREIFEKINFKKFSDTEIEAEIFGQKIKNFGLDIKAVTYHDLNIHQKKDGTWQATILFDI